jgi:hypothetical protein
MVVSFVVIGGNLHLNANCGGVCPDVGYSCEQVYTYLSSGWDEVCSCIDELGIPFDMEPPCAGSVHFNPNKWGPGQGGYEALDCPTTEVCSGAPPKEKHCTTKGIPLWPTEAALCCCGT